MEDADAALVRHHSLLKRLHSEPILCIAAENGDYQIVCYLIQAGADVNASSELDYDQGMTALIEDEQSQGKFVGEIEMILLKHGANVNAQDGDGESPLSEAVDDGNAERIQALVRAGARVNTINGDGDTP